jgi:DNA topoisomerase IA
MRAQPACAALYALVYRRTLASVMADALVDTTTARLLATTTAAAATTTITTAAASDGRGKYRVGEGGLGPSSGDSLLQEGASAVFRASGRVISFPGFLLALTHSAFADAAEWSTEGSTERSTEKSAAGAADATAGAGDRSANPNPNPSAFGDDGGGDRSALLPPLRAGDLLQCALAEPAVHETGPSNRFSVASFIR